MTATTEKEEKQLQKRFGDLARKAYDQNVYTFTSFLSLAEQDLFYRMQREVSHVGYRFWGGSSACERQMLRFGSPEQLGYEMEFPIVCLRIEPLLEKFADALTHRDFLGALMNLGIERSTMGDIFVQGKSAYLFCSTSIAPFIRENLDKVKHTNVRCVPVEDEIKLRLREPETMEVTVASERIDSVLSGIYNLSRSDSLDLFRERKVYVDGRLYENNSGILKPGSTVSVRGYGKLIYYGCKGETKKGKLRISAGIYR